MALCLCGCSLETKKGNKYIHGHNRKGCNGWNAGLTKETDERLQKMSNSLKGKYIGELSHLFGTKHSEEYKEKSRKITTELWQDSEFRIKQKDSHQNMPSGENHHFYGKHRTEEDKQKISSSLKGKYVGRRHTNETKLILSSISKQLWQDPNHIEKHKNATKQLWQNPEYARKMALAFNLKPNKPELLLIDLLNNLFPDEWKYVGDFNFWIGGKNPDFINFNKKLIIEHFGDYWHKNDDGINRIIHYINYGWTTLIIREHELKNINNIKEKIIKFNNKSMSVVEE